MEENRGINGNIVGAQEDPAGPASRPPSPRTAFDELRKVPMVADGIDKVVVVHERLKKIIPLYSFVTSVILYTAGWGLQRLEGYAVFQWSVELGDCVMLCIIDFMQYNFPMISLPTQELFGKLDKYLRQQVSVTASHVASYSLPQKICRLMEIVLKKLEDFVLAFTVNEERRLNMPWWYTPNFILAVYESTVNSALLFGVRHLNSFRKIVRNVRRAGAYIIAKGNGISHRRRVSPRISSRCVSPWIGYRPFVWLRNKLYWITGCTVNVNSASFVCDSSLEDTPHKKTPSQEKKRKLSDVEEESADSSEDMDYRALLSSLSSYSSDKDPDYVPFEPSTDSYEYRFSNEDESMGNSNLESHNEMELIMNARGTSDSSRNSGPVTDEPLLLKNALRKADDFVGNESASAATGNVISKVEDNKGKGEIKSTSTPEAKRKGILRW